MLMSRPAITATRTASSSLSTNLSRYLSCTISPQSDTTNPENLSSPLSISFACPGMPLTSAEFTMTVEDPARTPFSKGGKKTSLSIYAGVRSLPLNVAILLLFFKSLPWLPWMYASPIFPTRYASSPKVSKILGHRGCRPTSSTGLKFHGIPTARVSKEIVWAIFAIKSRLKLPPREIE
ncbi:hypothetical protein BpHYR1_026226 [Brachionus plicatilis]|uniref:Uncharacterized protein n=1 Tax=Brachionus plicatilis TaxID=10195 RepID=A0A3M7T3P9_BRAPC|nr:hypothetical protein BpHYR1_026226 [Brachionus plicatilis]